MITILFDDITEEGLLWNEFLGEICLCFLTSTINRTIHYTKDILGVSRDNIAFTDINMCPASNNYGGDHNHEALQELTIDVLVEVLKHCPNAKKTFFWGKNPNQYAFDCFLETTTEGRISRYIVGRILIG